MLKTKNHLMTHILLSFNFTFLRIVLLMKRKTKQHQIFLIQIRALDERRLKVFDLNDARNKIDDTFSFIFNMKLDKQVVFICLYLKVGKP